MTYYSVGNSRRRASAVGTVGVLLLVAGCSVTGTAAGPTHGGVAGAPSVASSAAPAVSRTVAGHRNGRDGVPAFRHVVVVVEHDASRTLATSADAPFLRGLGDAGLRLTDATAVSGRSPSGLAALVTGRTAYASTPPCGRAGGPTLARQLAAKGRSFAWFAGTARARGCRPLTALPRTAHALAALPSVAFVLPDRRHDMRRTTVAASDAWLQSRLGAFVRWSLTHDSLLVVTADASGGADRHVPLVLYGADLQSGTDSTRVDQYSVLRVVEDAFGLALLGHARTAAPITADWQPGGRG